VRENMKYGSLETGCRCDWMIA